MKTGLFLLAAIATLNSCSWYKDWQRSAVGDDKKTGRSRTVPREQYDQLLIKYEELSKKYEQLKEKPLESSLVDEIQSKSSENFSQTGSGETVDAFEAPAPVAAPTIEIDGDLNSQLTSFRRAQQIKDTNSSEATKIFQQLESSGHPTVKAKAKLEIGKILMDKTQYDLALQIFEDIIQKYSYSGAVLDALKYAKVCSEKLGLQNKKEQYSSMLSDVFESP